MSTNSPCASATSCVDSSVTTIPAAFNGRTAVAVRAYRLLGQLEQEDVAERMRRLGHPWQRATVSGVERGRRNVTTPELLTLVLVLGATVEELLDPRRPDQRGSGVVWLELNAEPPSVSIFAERLTALICRHKFDIGGPITLADDVSGTVVSRVQPDDEAQP